MHDVQIRTVLYVLYVEAIGVAIARGAAAVVARPPPQAYDASADQVEDDGLTYEGASSEYSPDAR